MRIPARFILTVFVGCLGSAAGLEAAETYTPIPINTNGSPRGYWEFLPAAYAANPTKEFPVVIFLHGLGEGGLGTVGGELNRVLANGVANNLNSPSNSIRALLNNQEVVVLCPQNASGAWWSSGSIRPFLDFALANYRIDPKRIYLTGLSSGSQGVMSFMNNDPNADQLAAAVVCAFRGEIDEGAPAQLVQVIPFWILTARGDWSSNPHLTLDLMASELAGLNVPTMLNTNPGGPSPTSTHTGVFSPESGWTWSAGIDAVEGVNPKVTIFPGSNHNSWTATYNSTAMWDWLLTQKKPEVTIMSPVSGHFVTPGEPFQLIAQAADCDDQVLEGAAIQWSSNLDGPLGTGTSLTPAALSPGYHVITCQAIDSKHRGARAEVAVIVPNVSSFSARFDFGSGGAGFPTTDEGWNNVTSVTAGAAGSIVQNTVDIHGTPLGIRLEVTQSFEGINTAGVASSALYPQSAQTDTLYVGNTTSSAEVSISGLNPSAAYEMTFFASRATGSNRVGVFTVNGDHVSLDATDNANQAVTLSNLIPDATGNLVLAITRGTGAAFGYLGVLTLTTSDGAPINAAPTVDAGTDQVILLPEYTTELQGTATDDGRPGSSLTMQWSLVEGPGEAIFDDVSNPVTPVRFTLPGRYLLKLSASDGELDSEDIVTVEVQGDSPTLLVAINAGASSDFTAADGTVFLADTWFTGGGSFTTTIQYANTQDNPLHQVYRYSSGGFSYNIPAGDGDYLVELFFADNAAAGARRFHVLIEGELALNNYDIRSVAGLNTAVIETPNVTVTDGTLNIEFQPLAGNAKVNALRIFKSGASLGGFDDWALEKELIGDDAFREADPDGDGLKNQIEQLFGSEPSLAEASPLAVFHSPDSEFLTLSFPRNTKARDMTVIVERSENFQHWDEVGRISQGIPSGQGFVSDIGTGGIRTTTFRDIFPFPEAGGTFMRLRILRP